VSFSAAGRGVSGGIGAAASVAASFALHAGIGVAFLSMGASKVATPPPFYRVNIVAAPSSPAPAAGLVKPAPTPPPPEVKKAAPRPKTDEVAPVPVAEAPKQVEKRATPSTSDTRVERNQPAPAAGGGEHGATGADVTTVRIEGIEFPYQGYLDNIVRQIRLRFQPGRGASTLKAEVMFLIRRDGSVSSLRFLVRSGNFTFDLEAQGAVEAAAKAGAFGPLPTPFKDDVLPVMFSFDPRLIR
jgi:outer membrane biosynthesis protein TonB